MNSADTSVQPLQTGFSLPPENARKTVNQPGAIPGVPLSSGEEIQGEFRPAAKYVSNVTLIRLIVSIVYLSFIFIPFLGVGLSSGFGSGNVFIYVPVILSFYILLPLSGTYYQYRQLKDTRYWVTNKRIIIRIPRRNARDVEIPIESVGGVRLSNSRRGYSRYFSVLFLLRKGASVQNGRNSRNMQSQYAGYSGSGSNTESSVGRTTVYRSVANIRYRMFRGMTGEEAERVKGIVDGLISVNSAAIS